MKNLYFHKIVRPESVLDIPLSAMFLIEPDHGSDVTRAVLVDSDRLLNLVQTEENTALRSVFQDGFKALINAEQFRAAGDATDWDFPEAGAELGRLGLHFLEPKQDILKALQETNTQVAEQSETVETKPLLKSSALKASIA